YNENDETQICIGQEEVTRVYNDTGVDIANGKPVYINGADSGWPTVELASSKTFDESRIIGLATSLIPDGGFGYVTERGPANDIDTSLYAEGTVIFLGETPGDLTDVRPTNGLFPVIIGIVTISHVSAGRISVFTNVSQYTAETVQALGWADTNQYTASFDNGTRTLTVTPVATEFRWYQSGIKYEEATDSLVIADTEGLRIIYYDEGTITELVKPSEGQISAIVRTNPTVVYVYWDATNQLCTYLGNEQHTIGYPADVHVEMHFTRGAQYLSGLGMTDIVSEATGDLDAHAQFGVESGLTEEEGVLTILAVRSSTEGLPIYHLSGIEADPDVRQIINAGFSVTTTGTGRLAWNELTGGSWQLTEVTNNQYVLCHVFALNDFVDSRKQIAFIGQTDYASVSAARLGADEEIKNIRTAGITSPELVPLATFVLQTSNTYGNAVQARVREIETGVDYVDWRQTELVGGGGTGAVNPQFSDALFRLFDDADATKQTAFQVSGVTAGTTRTLTVQDADGTIALTGDAPATHGSTHENGSADEINVGSLSGELADSQKTTVRKNTGSNVGTRRRLNLIEGTNVTLTVADDAANEEIDITIASSGGAGGGDVSGPGVSTDDAITRWDGTNGQLIQNSVVTMDDAGNINGAGTINSVNVADHNARHENGGADEMDVTDLSGLLADGQTPISHNASHEDAGADEIDVSNLSGELADPQKLTVRKNSGANVGSRPRLNLIEGSNITLTVADDGPGDEVDITIAGLGGSGDVTGPASSVDSELTLFNSTTGKLIKGGTGVAVDGSGNLTGVGTVNSVTVENHKSRHENGGADEISVADLSGLLADGQTPLGHNTSHANGGGDEIDLTGMSGLLGTAQTPVSHASSHQNGGGDQISVAGLTGLLGTPQTPAAHTQTASTITDFDAEVSNNASVVANTAKVSNATHTGDVTGSTALTIADGKVTYAKIQNVLANNVLLGNNSGAGSIVEELTGSEAKTLIGLGDVTNDAQVKKEASVTDGRIAIWDGTTGDALKDTGDAEIDGDLTLTGNLTATGAPIVELAGSATLTYASHYGRWLKVGGTGVRTLTIDATFHALATKDLEMHIQNLSSTAIDVIQISTPGGTTLSGVGNRLDVSAEDVATLKLVDDDEYFIFGGTE
ncbi:MAG: hypothetical protein KAS32_16390, partial [Candidatus Peribacteraceae bacterium]|nr:hypothetical protein [Candidatus Peribacteraceae bacterium]